MEKKLVVSLLKGSLEHLALRNRMICARNMGVHVQRSTSECKGMRKRDKKLDSRAAKKSAKKLVSSNFAKILE
jgi:hypothetical protein